MTTLAPGKKIIDILSVEKKDGTPYVSLEYFPPRTDDGVKVCSSLPYCCTMMMLHCTMMMLHCMMMTVRTRYRQSQQDSVSHTISSFSRST
jgi:hypothetical protein